MILISYATIVFFLLRVEGWNDRFFGRDGSKDEFEVFDDLKRGSQTETGRWTGTQDVKHVPGTGTNNSKLYILINLYLVCLMCTPG